MKRTVYQLLHQLLPPVFMRWLETRFLRVRYVGRFDNWQQATAASDGYDNQLILKRVTDATDQVIAGKAVCERDGVALDHVDYPWPMIYALQRAAMTHHNNLHVTDFGGSLGSTYRMIAPLLEEQIDMHWSVIEQPHFVEAGQHRYTTEKLDFHADVAACHAIHQPHVLLLSSVLPYLPNPYAMLQELLTINYNMIIIDRTLVIDHADDLLTVQKVPASFYGKKVSYPAWILSCERLLQSLKDAGYHCISQHDALAGHVQCGKIQAADMAMLFEKNLTQQGAC